MEMVPCTCTGLLLFLFSHYRPVSPSQYEDYQCPNLPSTWSWEGERERDSIKLPYNHLYITQHKCTCTCIHSHSHVPILQIQYQTLGLINVLINEHFPHPVTCGRQMAAIQKHILTLQSKKVKIHSGKHLQYHLERVNVRYHILPKVNHEWTSSVSEVNLEHTCTYIHVYIHSSCL